MSSRSPRTRRVVDGISATFRAGRLSGEGQIRNVSREGLFVRTRALPQLEEEIRIAFDHSGKRIEVRGTVRWTTENRADPEKLEPGFGVQLDRPGRDFIEFFQGVLAGGSPG